MKKQLFILIFGLVLLAGFVLASSNCPPVGPPKVFSGNVSYNANLLSGVYTLSALINNQVMGQVTVSNGQYSNLQVSPCSGVTGEIIFVVNGAKANEVSSWSNNWDTDWGQRVTLDLTLNGPPRKNSLCGDNAINLGEECDGALLAPCGTGWNGTISCSNTCVIDYSNCTKIQEEITTTPPSSGGGSSGGGSSGGGSSGPLTTTYTTLSTNGSSDSNSQDGETTNITSGQETKESTNFLTGGVIGFVKTAKGKGLIFVALIILAGIVVTGIQKKQKVGR